MGPRMYLLTNFQVMLLLLGREAHLEKRCARALHAGIATLATHRGQQGGAVWGAGGSVAEREAPTP